MRKDKNSNILAVGSHPDDIELGCAATIVKHLENGDRVYALILTKGEMGGHIADQSECFDSLTKLGVKKEDIFFGNLSDGFVSDSRETVNLIEELITKLNINRVYTHDYHDRHQDHRNCSKAVSSAARKVEEILLFQGPSTDVSFQPHFFEKITPTQLKKKISALASYKSQVKKGIVELRRVSLQAGVNGGFCNSRYAEAFALNHLIRGETDV